MKKKILPLLLLLISSIGSFAQLNMSYVGSYQYDEDLSDIWGYAAPDGTEYALVGVYNGVSIVNLSDPANPVEADFIPGPNSIWRDIKTWDHYAYVTNETGGGVLVIDLSNLPGTVTSHFWAPNIPGLGTLSSIHNLWIDEFGYIYLSGSTLNGGGLVFVDVFTDPWNPAYAGKCAPAYSHDVYVRNNLAYSAEINTGVFTIYDVTDKSNPVALGSQQTGASTAHNTWLSDNGQILFTTDETGNGPVGSYDVSDPSNILTLDQFRPIETLGEGVIPHNVHVWDDYIIISYYTDGCIIVDAARPDNLIEVGNFDTYIPANTGFDGAWGAYPFLPSGLVLVSDIGNGLYILEPNYVRACYLEGNVTDAVTSAGLNGATIEIVGQLANTFSNLIGDYKTGLATAGVFDVLVKKAGYESKTVSVNLENGVLTNLNVALQPLPSFLLGGTVVEVGTGLPVSGAKVQLINADFEFNLTTGVDGKFSVQQFFNGDYDVFAGKWGFKTTALTAAQIDGTTGNLTIEISKGYEDIFSLDLGWIVNGDAPQGIWERGAPIEVAPAQIPYPIQSGSDSADDPGNACYVTGNVSDLVGGLQLSGTTRLISPVMDLTGMNAPHLNFKTWFFSFATNGAAVGNDKLTVKLANGDQTIIIKEFSFTSLFVPPTWESTDMDISTLLPITNAMQVIFEVGDIDPNFTDAVEAGVDFFQAYDDDPPSGIDNLVENGISITASPNPSSTTFTLSFKIDNFRNEANLLVYNALGQMVETHDLESRDGKIVIGSNLEGGIYFAQIVNNGEMGKPIKLLKQR
ncbi:MAG: choice-of-anchor B family protein [Saprospiraceae bacterium]|nr:choice-of-anchor B family protein [Saprospiraceae bacterium]MCF8249694.1 choice-of-anchor B family protein [Saprospiraceae bacterium]MCF8279853.1 choice-of-anchor B family protein [Bacteroidales bacterium]MCF8312319.1 choice-of-anchor B family protein [Saprospiraceae bacterium]MCF8440684.1 choice-of-anchor B family protein [Saprospiraceae bacterium]